MEAIIARLLAWTVANSGYPAPAQPLIEYRPASYFGEQVCAGAKNKWMTHSPHL